MAKSFAFDCPDAALDALADRLSTVSVERDVATMNVTGRVLAQEVVADRDSPAADVSAMDGYAIRLSDLQTSDSISIGGESAPGGPPPELIEGSAVRIFTGAIIPEQTDAVIKREDTVESEGAIRFRDSAMSATVGEHIRRAGENAKQGSGVLSPGLTVAASHQATLANFGCQQVDVYEPVKVGLITTGDEVGLFSDEPPKPWQLRNSNRFAIASVVGARAWAEFSEGGICHCRDDRQALTQMLEARLGDCDAVLLTGGVSMGDYDYVPDIVQALGGEIIFHGLPLRPGKPILGAATKDGKLIMGLPGNPVSATIGCRRMALPLLAKMSGQSDWAEKCATVKLESSGSKTIPLHWMRLVEWIDHGRVQLVASRGSGDLVSLGNSSGFVHLPPGASGEGPWPYYGW